MNIFGLQSNPTFMTGYLPASASRNVKTSSGIPLKVFSSDQNVNSSMNFKQYYEGWASNLKYAGRLQKVS